MSIIMIMPLKALQRILIWLWMTGFMNSWTLQVNYSWHLKDMWMQQLRLLSVQFWWLHQSSELIVSTEQSDQSHSAPDWFLPFGLDWQYCFFPLYNPTYDLSRWSSFRRVWSKPLSERRPVWYWCRRGLRMFVPWALHGKEVSDR